MQLKMDRVAAVETVVVRPAIIKQLEINATDTLQLQTLAAAAQA